MTLRILDLLGREVTTLVHDELEPGAYTSRWDASGIASGVYLYTLSVRDSDPASPRDSGAGSGASTATRRLVVLR